MCQGSRVVKPQPIKHLQIFKLLGQMVDGVWCRNVTAIKNIGGRLIWISQVHYFSVERHCCRCHQDIESLRKVNIAVGKEGSTEIASIDDKTNDKDLERTWCKVKTGGVCSLSTCRRNTQSTTTESVWERVGSTSTTLKSSMVLIRQPCSSSSSALDLITRIFRMQRRSCSNQNPCARASMVSKISTWRGMYGQQIAM